MTRGRMAPRPDGAFAASCGDGQGEGGGAGRRELDGAAAGLERRGRLIVIRSAALARQVLRARAATRQAGFTAEHIPMGRLRRHPILFSDGPQHDGQRSELARFFAPSVIESRWRPHLEGTAARLLDAKPAGAAARLDALALRYSVEVSAEIVGLTASPSRGLASRLESFFRQPPVDMARDDLGRTPAQWALAAWRGLVPLVRFHLADVRPAIRARRREPREDIVSRLLAEGCSEFEILVECATYGTAGMVTTREFIALAAWRLLDDPPLAARFRAAEREERLDLLAEMLRLDPVVGRLYRRVVEALPLEEACGGAGGDRAGAGAPLALQPGDLVELRIDEVNADPAVFGSCPHAFDAQRAVPPGIDRAGWTFGDGAHRCPGRGLALLQAEALLGRLLERQPELVRPPQVQWDDLLGGFALRGGILRWQ